MDWDKIRTVGVYRINRYSIDIIVEPKDYDTFSFLGQKFIFLSTKPNYTPKRNEATSSDFIHFHWRELAWNEIQKYYKDRPV